MEAGGRRTFIESGVLCTAGEDTSASVLGRCQGTTEGGCQGSPGRELFDGCQHSDSYFIKDCMHVFKNVVEYRNIV